MSTFISCLSFVAFFFCSSLSHLLFDIESFFAMRFCSSCLTRSCAGHTFEMAYRDSVLFGFDSLCSLSLAHSSIFWVVVLLLFIVITCVWLQQTRRSVSSSHADILHVYWLRKHHTHTCARLLRWRFEVIERTSFCQNHIVRSNIPTNRNRSWVHGLKSGGFMVQTNWSEGKNNRVSMWISVVL